MTIGSITENKEKSFFSSVGYSADERVKPDVVALGSNCTVVDSSGNIRYASGTSFSTPIVAGLALCLWQALPQLNNLEIIKLIQSSSSQYEQPDPQTGYGIPNIHKALKQKQEKWQMTNKYNGKN
jgi:subtilisin family serine protease